MANKMDEIIRKAKAEAILDLRDKMLLVMPTTSSNYDTFKGFSLAWDQTTQELARYDVHVFPKKTLDRK